MADEMSFETIELMMKQLSETTAKDTLVLDSVAAEIHALNERLRKLQDQKRDLNHNLFKYEQDKTSLASKRERLHRQMLANLEIAKTAQRVSELMLANSNWVITHDYQKADIISAVHAYLSGYTGFMNANDMGLGKTMEALLTLQILRTIFIEENKKEPNILWLTKTSILQTGGTNREQQRWTPDMKLVPLFGSSPKSERESFFKIIQQLQQSVAVITNYETVRTTDALNAINWDFIVMDEVHKLKGGANANGPTAIWKAVKDLTVNTRMTLMLTGTPMVNKPSEMWAYLNIFDPERFPRLRDFENLFCNYSGFDLQVDADKLLDQALVGRMIRRAKTDEDVKIELPSITPYEDRTRLVQMSGEQLKAYEMMRDKFFIWLDEQNPDEIFTATAIIAQLTRLRQINVWPVVEFTRKDEDGNIIDRIQLDIHESAKIDELMDIIEDVQDQIVIFGTYNAPFDEVCKRASQMGLKCGILSGAHSKDMKYLENDFQQGKIDVLCVNSVMGEGLNLQKSPQWPGGSSTVVFLDLWWNSARNDQCTDRVYRQGAVEPVTVIHLKSENSVDQYIDLIIEAKDKEIKGVTGSSKLRPSDWKQMLKGKI